MTTDTFVITPPTFPVMIMDDNVAEGEEELTVVLTQFLPDIVIRAPNVSRLIIQDNGMAALTMTIFYHLFHRRRSVLELAQFN